MNNRLTIEDFVDKDDNYLFGCAITWLTIENDAIISPEGRTYSEKNITKWLENSNLSDPFTRDTLTLDLCRPNHLFTALKNHLDFLLDQESIDLTSLKYFLICPISQTIFKHPVVAADGNTYDKDALLSQKSTDLPYARLASQETYPNRFIQNLLTSELIQLASLSRAASINKNTLKLITPLIRHLATPSNELKEADFMLSVSYPDSLSLSAGDKSARTSKYITMLASGNEIISQLILSRDYLLACTNTWQNTKNSAVISPEGDTRDRDSLQGHPTAYLFRQNHHFNALKCYLDYLFKDKPQSFSSLKYFLICPLSQNYYTDPVVAADGNTYDKAALLQHQNKKTTYAKLANQALYPNVFLANFLQLKSIQSIINTDMTTDDLNRYLVIAPLIKYMTTRLLEPKYTYSPFIFCGLFAPPYTKGDKLRASCKLICDINDINDNNLDRNPPDETLKQGRLKTVAKPGLKHLVKWPGFNNLDTALYYSKTPS